MRQEINTFRDASSFKINHQMFFRHRKIYTASIARQNVDNTIFNYGYKVRKDTVTDIHKKLLEDSSRRFPEDSSRRFFEDSLKIP